jgi:hypothetical protein
MSAFAPFAYGEPGQGLGFFNALLDAAEWSEGLTLPLSKSQETNILLALRGIANGFQVPDSHASPLDWAQPVRGISEPTESSELTNTPILVRYSRDSCMLLMCPLQNLKGL